MLPFKYSLYARHTHAIFHISGESKRYSFRCGQNMTLFKSNSYKDNSSITVEYAVTVSGMHSYAPLSQLSCCDRRSLSSSSSLSSSHTLSSPFHSHSCHSNLCSYKSSLPHLLICCLIFVKAQVDCQFL